MKNLIIILVISLLVSLAGCSHRSLIYHGSTTEGKNTILVSSKKYEKQLRLRHQFNARRAAQR